LKTTVKKKNIKAKTQKKTISRFFNKNYKQKKIF